MQESAETFSELVVSGCKAAKLLEAVEESLDEIVRLVAVPINLARPVPIAAARGNDSFSSCELDGGHHSSLS